MNFDGILGELKAKGCFQRQLWAKCIRQTLFFMQNSVIGENFNFYFSAVFC